MAKGKKTGGRDFQSGHNIGRPRLSEDIKQVRKLTKTTFTEMTNELLYMTSDELRSRLGSQETPVLELLIGSAIKSAISTGNINKIQVILDRLVDKYPLQEGAEILQRAPIEISIKELVKIARDEAEDDGTS
jgi:hypothetical protein